MYGSLYPFTVRPHSENVIAFAICGRTQIRINNFNAVAFCFSREEKIRRREETSQNIEENVLQEDRMAQVTTLSSLI